MSHTSVLPNDIKTKKRRRRRKDEQKEKESLPKRSAMPKNKTKIYLTLLRILGRINESFRCSVFWDYLSIERHVRTSSYKWKSIMNFSSGKSLGHLSWLASDVVGFDP